MAAEPQRRDDAAPPTPHTTGERLRDATDAGLTGDKVPYGDPAASPLGTDSEAGGSRPSPADIPPTGPTPSGTRPHIPEGQAKGYEMPPRKTYGIGLLSALAAAAVALVLAALFL